SRRAARRRNLLLTPRGPNRHRELAAPLQHDQAARLTWIQATGTGGIRARLRRVAGCAIPSGSAGHAGETANLKLTFHLDHSEGADHYVLCKFLSGSEYRLRATSKIGEFTRGSSLLAMFGVSLAQTCRAG